MAGEDILSDEYVATLLAKDANVRSIKYSAMGLQAFLPERPTRAPKPNTRFLRNILRETDSHNAALLAKERDDANGRLKSAVGPSRQGRVDAGTEAKSNGKRHMEDLLRHVKRRRLSEGDDEQRRQQRDHRGRRSRRTVGESSREEDSDGRTRHSRNYESNISKEEERERRTYRSSRHRDKDSRHEDRPQRHRRRRSQSISHSHSRSRSASPRRHGHSYKSSRRRKPSPSPSSRSSTTRAKIPRVDFAEKKPGNSHINSPTPSLDSDPLESLIGPPAPPPQPKIRSKGRGTFASSSAMDTHFSTTYDPSIDVQPPSDPEDGWDQAIEAFRDRQKWKQQGAERLKLAGFTDEEVRKWEKGGRAEARDEDVETVRWRAKGEGREWDRGKVIGDDGHVGSKAEWGRLKGT